MSSRSWIALGLCTLLTTPSFADFRCDETTQITGGSIVSMMKFVGAFSKDAKKSMDPITSTVLVQGNRMARINPDHTEIIDLDKETITTIDHKKKQYTVMTFDQMKQQMEEATKKAKEEQAKAKPSQPQGNDAPPPKMNFKVNVRNTAATKNVAGLDAKESILDMELEATDQQSGQTGSLAITNDMWMVPEIPGYDEVRDFNKRFAMKMGTVFGDTFKPTVAAMQPGSTEGMAAMAKEMSKLKGVPVMQVMRMGSTTNGQPLLAASEAPLPASNGPSAGDVAKQGVGSAISSKLGGFGGFGKKKDPPPEQPKSAPAATPTQSVLMESSTQMASFSSAPINSSQFSVPAGYAQIARESNPSGH
ncbi:MAG: hypothetical protein ACXWCH_34760 [Burkholderiales bacterium]